MKRLSEDLDRHVLLPILLEWQPSVDHPLHGNPADALVEDYHFSGEILIHTEWDGPIGFLERDIPKTENMPAFLLFLLTVIIPRDTVLAATAATTITIGSHMEGVSTIGQLLEFPWASRLQGVKVFVLFLLVPWIRPAVEDTLSFGKLGQGVDLISVKLSSHLLVLQILQDLFLFLIVFLHPGDSI
jgi:hypothetical protein